MHSLKLMKDSLWRLFRGASVTLAAMGMLFTATNAVAACGDPSGLKPGVALKLPFLAQPERRNRAGASRTKRSRQQQLYRGVVVRQLHIGRRTTLRIVRSVAQ